MKLLIVSQHFYPDNFRINELAPALYKQGYDITVITSLPDYETGKVPANCKGLKNRKINYNGVKVLRTFSVSRRSGILFRALNYVSFCISSTVKALFIKEKFDMVLCYQTSPVLMANAARKIANRQKIPFVLYCLDIWPECLKAWNVPESNPLYKFMHNYSRKIYNRADSLVVSSKLFSEYMQKVNGVPKEKITFIPQHSDNMNLPQKPIKSGDVVSFAFGGNIGAVQNISCIINAVSEIKKANVHNFKVDIYGSGSELNNCISLAESLCVEDRITFHGRVSKKTLFAAYNNADAFLLTLKPQGYIGYTVPAKLQEYMSGNRPVFASADKGANDVIVSSGCGITVNPDDYKSLAKEMINFINNPEDYSKYAVNGKQYFEENYTLQQIVSSWDKHIKFIMGK